MVAEGAAKGQIVVDLKRYEYRLLCRFDDRIKLIIIFILRRHGE